MSNEITEPLPKLIARAASALAAATSAAEVLEARDHAKVAYDAARIAARMAKAKDAHDDVLAACQKVMADALVIEAQAQCRLADEYDAAQERGEVQRHGGQGKRDIPNENIPSPVTDIGLTSKQVHEARAVRDAEKADPGVVRKAVAGKLRAKQEPTRADVKRAVNPKKKAAAETKQQIATRNLKIIAMWERGLSSREIAADVGLVERAVHQVIEHEKIARAARAEPILTREDLSLSGQKQFDIAIKQYQKKLAMEFESRVREEARRRVDEFFIPSWKKQIDDANSLLASRRGLMDKATFNTIRRALHPDSRESISNEKLAVAFDTFMRLEIYLLDENSPQQFGEELPSNLAEWDKMRANRKPHRAKSKANSPVRY